MFSRTLHAQHPVTMNLNTSPRFSPTILYRDANSVPTSTPFDSSINRLYAQSPGFEIVRKESVKVYLHMHNGNVEQNPLCVESCVTNGFSISPRLSPTMFDPDANSVLLRAHLCTSVDFMCRKARVRNCSRERKGLYNGTSYLHTFNIQQQPCEPLSAFRFFFFFFFFLCVSAWHRKPPQVYSSVVYTPRHAKTSSHSHPQKQSLGLRHNKALACIPPARSWLLLRVIWQAGLVKVASLFGRQFSS